MSESLKGKTALVTGAAGGIGQAIVTALADEGAGLFLTSRGKGEVERLAKQVKKSVKRGPEVHSFPGDLTEESEVTELFRHVMISTGAPDIIVNAAGVGTFGKIEELELEDLYYMLQVNLVVPFLLAKKFVPRMEERGSGAIVNIASIAGIYGYPGCSGYGASKAALIGLSRSLREELMPKGIRVFTVCPSSVDTPFMNNVPKHIPRDKMLKPEDVARVVVRLVSQPDRVVEEEVIVKPMAFRPYI